MTLRCPTCPGPEFVQVRHTGPSPCPILLLGAGPAKRENTTGLAYSGLAGDELRHTYLRAAYLNDETDVTIGNSVRCWDGTDRTPSEKRVMDCASCHLPALLESVRPEVVVLMGGVTTRLADKRIRLDMHHGIPQRNSLLNGTWEGWVWPSYEPALGMRETTKMSQLYEDFRNLGRWWRGEWNPVVATEVEKDYQIVRTESDLKSYLRMDQAYDSAAMDTERHGSQSWSVQISHTPHTGRLIRSADRRLLELLDWWLKNWDVEVSLHNAGQDLDELDRLGVHPSRFRDTMQEAYHQCSLPQGLKALAYRLFGVTMRSWEDVVWPASIDAVTEWIGESIWLASGGPAPIGLQDEIVHPLVRGKCVECGHQHSKGPCKRDGCGCVSTNVTFERTERKSGPVEQILRHVLRYTTTTMEEEEPYNPWKKITEMKETGLRGKVASRADWEWIEERVGPMPILGIGNVKDEADEIEYSVGDADVTGMVATELERRRGDARWKVAREDWDQ